MNKPLNIRHFFKLFPDDDSCLDHVFKVRFGEHTECPKCSKSSSFHRLKKRPAYSCQHCGHHIHPCAGTPFENTRTPLQLWFYAIYLFTTSRHGVPAKELQRQLSVTYKTAWRMGHEIRKHMAKTDGDDDLSGHIEVDETYIGGKTTRDEKGNQFTNKTVVLGMVERDGRAITKVVENNKSKTILPVIEKHVVKGSRISSDQYQSYKQLPNKGYEHGYVNHSREQWAKIDAQKNYIHTNNIESYWSHFKNSIRGTHKYVSKKHMQKYLGEFEFRFNLRHRPDLMFDYLIQSF